jgi:hypothetical protein
MAVAPRIPRPQYISRSALTIANAHRTKYDAATGEGSRGCFESDAVPTIRANHEVDQLMSRVGAAKAA